MRSYVGISIGAPSPNRFEEAVHSHGVYPQQMTGSLKIEWNVHMRDANLKFMAQPPTIQPPTIQPPIIQPPIIQPPTITFLTIEGQTILGDHVHDPVVAKDITEAIQEIFHIHFPVTVTYQGSMTPHDPLDYQDQRLYFKFVEGNSGSQRCTTQNTCFGWTGIGANAANGGLPPKRRYLVAYHPNPTPAHGENRFKLVGTTERKNN
ncbi:hypothetical protein BDP27DRAFT_1430268 [Rhodocollybia butyracea]|uniref:Uncharacterized protein n=1 Tax=Rhodocollybia butyracea TaxID=206335 RepID=A0A9P5TZH3_9AGAR|nr:hypothetical protein BDP27DRAFT_1430268 [Rhodocollybia butyracea]